MSIWENIVQFFKNLFRKKPAPVAPTLIELVWSVDTLNPDGGTQCLPKTGSASTIDWSVGLQPLGWPGVMYKASHVTVESAEASGYLSVSLQRYMNGSPVPGWVPTIVSQSTFAEMNLGGAFVEGAASMQAQVAFSPMANAGPIHNVKVTMTLVKV